MWKSLLTEPVSVKILLMWGYTVGVSLYCKVLAPALVVLYDELILGTDAIKPILPKSNLCESYSTGKKSPCPETVQTKTENFLSVL